MLTKKRVGVVFVVILVTVLCISYYNAKTKSLPILMYHSCKENYPIENSSLYVTPQVFEKQISDLIAKGYTFISYYDLFDYMNDSVALPEKPIIITFDDGYLDNYINVLPVLEKYNAKATIFVVTDALLDEEVEYNESEIQYMSWGQAMEMQNSGLVDIESHTKNHYNLANLTVSEVDDQLRGSKEEIKAQIGKESLIISLPYGGGNKKIIEQCGNNGYKMTTLVYPNIINKINGFTNRVSRIPITNESDINTLLP